MQFYELEACLAIADTLNLARACVLVHLSPSALSRLVSRLEDELGVKLFIRDTRSVTLTEDGKKFIQFARATLRSKDDLLLSYKHADGKLHGALRIFASVTACYSILPPLVESLTKKHPSLKLIIETGDPADASLAVKEGKADIAVDANHENENPNTEFFAVRRSPLVFATSSSSEYGAIFNSFLSTHKITNCEFSNEELISLLKQIPLVLAKTGLSRIRFDKWCKTNNFKPNIAAESGGHEGVLALSRLGIGAGLVPRIVLENSPFERGLVSVPTCASIGYYDIGFILPKVGKMNEQMHNTLVELIRTLR